jgi:iron-sulfur cluster assembly protein
MMAIQLTERAAEHIQKTLENSAAAIGLRLSVRKTGCTGFGYVVELADSIQESDQVFEQHGVKVIVDAVSLPTLEGTEVDFVTKGLNRSFEFRNPNAEHYCGCGESFSIKGDK